MADSDVESESSGISELSKPDELLEKFEEDETALKMAAEEEARLKKEASDRIAALGVRDPMLDEAMDILVQVEEEKLNDHGKPWKKPPPVLYSPEYWRDWQQQVKIDKQSYNPEEVARRHRKAEAERRRNRPKLRAPLPEKYNRYGKLHSVSADFSEPRYFVSSKNNPRCGTCGF